jgi:hypothetical protein
VILLADAANACVGVAAATPVRPASHTNVERLVLVMPRFPYSDGLVSFFGHKKRGIEFRHGRTNFSRDVSCRLIAKSIDTFGQPPADLGCRR